MKDICGVKIHLRIQIKKNNYLLKILIINQLSRQRRGYRRAERIRNVFSWIKEISQTLLKKKRKIQKKFSKGKRNKNNKIQHQRRVRKKEEKGDR